MCIPNIGERVPYVIIYGEPGKPLIQSVRSPDEVLKGKWLDKGDKISHGFKIKMKIAGLAEPGGAGETAPPDYDRISC